VILQNFRSACSPRRVTFSLYSSIMRSKTLLAVAVAAVISYAGTGLASADIINITPSSGAIEAYRLEAREPAGVRVGGRGDAV
jgi:hypothetical protein